MVIDHEYLYARLALEFQLTISQMSLEMPKSRSEPNTKLVKGAKMELRELAACRLNTGC